MDILSRYGYKTKKTIDTRPAEAQQRDNLPELVRYTPPEGSFKVPERTPIADVAQGALAGLKGLGQGIQNFDAGAIQALLYGGTQLGLVDEQRLQNYQTDIAKMQEEQVRTNPLGDVGRTVGNLIPAALGPAPAAKGILSNLALQTGMGGVYGAMTPVSTPQEISSNVDTGLKIGGAIGAIGALPAAASKLFSRPLDEAADVLSTAKELGIKPTVGQVTGNVPLRTVEEISKEIPIVGTYGNFNKQLQTLKATAEDLIKNNKPLKDVNASIHQGLVASKIQKTTESSKMIDEFTALAGQTNKPVPFTQTRNAVKSLISGEESLWKKISTSDRDLATDTVRNVNHVLTEANDTQTAIQSLDLRQRLLQLGRESKGPVKHVYNELAAAVDKDISAFAAKESPELANKYHAWSKFYKTEVLPFNGKGILKVLTDPKVDLDTVFSKVIKKDSFYRATSIAKNLSKETNTDIAGSLIGKVFNEAIDAGKGNFDPNVFSKGIQKLGDTKEVFLSSATKAKLEAYGKVLKALDLSSESATQGIGSSANMALRTGGTIGAAIYSPAIAGSVVLLSHALMSPKTSAMLIKLGKLEPKSQAFKRVFSNLQFAVIKELQNKPEQLDEPYKPDILTRIRRQGQ